MRECTFRMVWPESIWPRRAERAGGRAQALGFITDDRGLAEMRKQSDATKIKRLRSALRRIAAMAARPQCFCGLPTGTGAIKLCAQQTLSAVPASNRRDGSAK